LAAGQLYLWSATRNEWVSCPPDEITWLDRRLLSNDEDVSLHRAPRCAGLRYVHRRWELFSRDTTYRVYLAPETAGTSRDSEAVRRAARHVLPAAPAQYEALPVALSEGSWLVSVGPWVLRLRLDAAQVPHPEPTMPDDGKQLTTRAMAFYYQEFIRGLPAPQSVPMMHVVIALDLSGEGAVSDYKKLLQGFIWKERGHARDLADFLLANGLLTPADLDEAGRVAMANERSGVCERARQRLSYRPKGN
jgi:hypothetical protein